MKRKIIIIAIEFIIMTALLFLLTGDSRNYVYAHYNEVSLINGPIHLRANSYEEFDDYYKFTFDTWESTLSKDSCTLFNSTYCPVCKERINIDWK